MKRILAMIALSAFALATNPVQAAGSFAEIKAKLDDGANELAEVDAILADPDPNRRTAAMQLLIESGNPVFIRRATQVGLYSTDGELRQLALASIFKAGAPFNLQIDFSGITDDALALWREFVIENHIALAADQQSATLNYVTTGYDEKLHCATIIISGNAKCFFIVQGENITFMDSRIDLKGQAKLGTDGALLGSLVYSGYHGSSYGPVPLRIRLVE